MKKGKEKSEWNQKVYHFRVWTFRRTLELRVWKDEKSYKEVWEWTPYEDYYNYTSWCYFFDEEHNCNIIWLKEYNLNTLVHELIHCVEQMCKQVWIPMEWEPPAFIYEELFTKIMMQCKNKFKLDEDTEWFFKH